MTLFSEAKGRKVVDLTTATTLGVIADYVVDPTERTVAAIVLKKATDSGSFIAWDRITAFGADAVTVADGSAVTAADGSLAVLTDKSKAFHGKRLLTTAGEVVGAVEDIDFDPGDGALNFVVPGDGDTVAGDRVLATGSYAVIVKA